jgi:hypothetical protein
MHGLHVIGSNKPRHLVRLSRQFRLDCGWWRRLVLQSGPCGMILDRRLLSSSFIAWDASETWGIGGFYAQGHQFFSIPWSAFYEGSLICDLAPTGGTPSWHINYMELYAGFTAIRKWGSSLRGCTVICYTDSSSVYSWITKFWGPTSVIPLLKRLHLMLVRFDILLQPVLIKSKENAICDCLSRGSVEGFHAALEAWIARGRSTDAYIERVDTVPDTPPPQE